MAGSCVLYSVRAEMLKAGGVSGQSQGADTLLRKFSYEEQLVASWSN